MFTIDYKSRLPLYEQLVESIKARTLSGVLNGDDPLPSVRQLSAQLGINPNTVQKAYTLLEQQGIIYTVPGKGNFIRPDTETLKQRKIQDLLQTMTDTARQLQQLGVSADEIQIHLASALREEETT